MQTASSANCTCRACLSMVECTATQGIPISCAVRMTRTAISPLFATSIFSNSQVADRAPLRALDFPLLDTMAQFPPACFRERDPEPVWKLLLLLRTLLATPARSGDGDALEVLHWRCAPSTDATTRGACHIQETSQSKCRSNANKLCGHEIRDLGGDRLQGICIHSPTAATEDA